MRRRGSSQLSKPKAESALTMLLTGCTKERLASFTAQGLAGSYNVPLATAERLLMSARQGWLL
jgi:hypothetical protein